MIAITANERRSLKRVISLLDVDKRGFALSVVLGSGALGAAIALGATAAWLIARASQHPPVLYLTVAAVSVRFFGISRAVLRYLSRLASHSVAMEGMDSLRQNLYNALSVRRIDRVTMLRRGDLLARTGSDVDDVGDLVVKTFLPTIVAAVCAIGTVVGLALLSPATALLVAACLLVSGVVAPLLAMKAARISELDSRRARTELSAGALALLEGASELQISGRIDELRAALRCTEDELTDSMVRAARISALATGVDRAAMGLAVVGALLIGIPQTTAETVAAVGLAVLVLTPLSAFEGTSELAGAGVQLIRSATAAQRIADLLGDEEPLEAHPVPDSDVPVLEASGLAIGWPGGPVLVDGIDLRIEPGRSVGIVGASGIGKTTLALTLAGLLEPKAGRVTLNGVDVWTADRADVTRLVTVTAEDAHVFATSVIENLRVARADLTVGEAEVLCHRVGLDAWLAALPHGLDTLIGSGGTTVSGGERRRLLMARALASAAPLQLVDEAAEHLDAATADALVHTLLRDDAHRGVLLISHRLSALDAADELLVLERDHEDEPAKVAARGAHAALMAANDAYRWARSQEDA